MLRYLMMSLITFQNAKIWILQERKELLKWNKKQISKNISDVTLKSWRILDIKFVDISKSYIISLSLQEIHCYEWFNLFSFTVELLLSVLYQKQET